MSFASPARALSAVVSRLRAAGCVFAEDEAQLLISAARSPAELDTMVGQRVAGQPVEHVLGWASFCGIRVSVAAGVFVPRRRTEFLVDQAATLAPPGPVVVDLCCGSGAVGAAMATLIEGIELHAVDIDPAAVQCARRNLAGAGGHVYHGDLYQPLPEALCGRIDVLTANAPYVPSGSLQLLPPEARLHEPRAALDGGADGLDVVRRVTGQAPRWLAAGGHLLVEASQRQAPTVVGIFTSHGLSARVSRSPAHGATVVIGTKTK